MMAKSVVILRPEGDTAEIAAAIEAQNFIPFVEPILSIDHSDADYSALEEGAPLIFTSAHGVRAFAAKNTGRAHPVYTVGRNTADEARQSGFTQIESADGTAAEMVDLFTTPLKTALKTPIYVRGEDVSSDLRDVFAKNGLNIAEIVAYKANLASNLSLDLLKLADKGKIEAVMFFSVRGARHFASLVQQYDRLRVMKGIKALCISDGVVDCLSVLPFQEVIVADQPDRYGMIHLLERLS